MQNNDRLNPTRRACSRANLNSFIFCWLGVNEPIIECTSYDIGEGGICFNAPMRISPGKTIWMQVAPVDYQHNFPQTVYAKARIVWADEPGNKDTGRFRMGAAFTAIDTKDRKLIGQYADNSVSRI
jgi:hypothetical protein